MDKYVHYTFSSFFIAGLLTQGLINFKWWIGYPVGMILFLLLMIMYERLSSKQETMNTQEKTCKEQTGSDESLPERGSSNSMPSDLAGLSPASLETLSSKQNTTHKESEE